METPRRRSARLAHRFAVATAACSVPLILFGGSVTTLGAGMAVDGWLVAEGHFLPLFPVEKWFRDLPTIVEHTHRLFGVLVGLCAALALAFGWRAGRPWMPLAALVAVCGQGALGGFRVLEDSPELAFLHGALAQAVFALLVVVAVTLSGRWSEHDTRPSTGERGDHGPHAPRGLARAARLAVTLVFAQVVLGAWYRHGLRTGLDEGLATRLALHFAGAFCVALAVFALAGRLERLVAEAGAPAPLVRGRRDLLRLLGVQLFLGLFAWAARTAGPVSGVEWATSVLHVLFGGLLLAQCATIAVWIPRVAPREERAGAATAAQGGAA
jgi:cytochrome c oxidase assembly protein subunit 15